MELALWSAVFFVAVLALVWSSSVFTDGAEELSVFLRVPPYVVGVTIVAIGTSLPELASSVAGVLRGSPEIVVGNVVGSNIANIFLVLGFAAIVGGVLSVSYEIVHVDLPMLVSSAGFAAFVVWDGVVTRPEGLVLLTAAVVYILYGVSVARHRGRLHEEIEEEIEEELRIERGKLDPLVWPRLVGGALLLWLSAEYTVRSVVQLSEMLEIGTELIAVSAVAVGTSLPELAVSVVAARKGSLEVAMGNVLGSCVFNSLAVLGVTSIIGALPATGSVLSLGVPVMIGATLLYFFMAEDREVTRWEGSLLVLFYALFIGRLFGLL